MPCSSTQGGSGVAIQSCSFTLQPSPAGNPDYFVNVTLNYATPNVSKVVRFRCALGNASQTVSQYGVLRASGGTLKFVSPFVSPAVKSVQCFVDKT
jgi:hypothetical protein